MPDADLVVDTHVWLWSVLEDAQRLTGAASRRLRRATTAAVPAIAQWEAALLVAGGRLALDRPARDWIGAAAALEPFSIAPLSPEIAVVAADLQREGFHGDPADRMIYATARVLDAPLLTADRRIHAFDRALPRSRGRRVIWD